MLKDTEKRTKKKDKYLLLSVCLIVSVLCFMPVIIDYATDSKPYALSTKEMIVVKEMEDCNDTVGEIISGHRIRQTFTCTLDSIDSIVFKAGTYKRINNGTLYIELADLESGEVVDAWQRDISEIEDNKPLILYSNLAPGQIHMDNREYAVTIYSENAYKGNALTLYCATEDLYKDGFLLLEDQRAPGDLIMTITGFESVESYERVKIWLCFYLTAAILVSMAFLRGKYFDQNKL